MDKAKLEQVKKDIELLKKEQVVIEQRIEDSKKSVLEAGDIVMSNEYAIRVIVKVNGNLTSYNGYGTLCGSGQSYFNQWGYRKIGTIEDFKKLIN